MAPQRNKHYANQARLTLQNLFPRISCAAIDAVIRSSNFKFTDAFHFLTNIETQRIVIDESGAAGQFEGIPSHIKVFIKGNRPKKTFQLTDQLLCGEIDSIPELNTKEKSQPGDVKVDEVKDDDND